MTTPYPPQKYVQTILRYRCEDGHVFGVIRPRALRGYHPVLKCPEVPALGNINLHLKGFDCERDAKHVGEGGYWPMRYDDRRQVREANRERGTPYPHHIYRRGRGGRLKITGGL